MNEKENSDDLVKPNTSEIPVKKEKNNNNRLVLIGLIALMGLSSLALVMFSPPSTSDMASGGVLLGGVLLLLNYIPATIGFILSLIGFVRDIKLKDNRITIINLFFMLIFVLLPYIFFRIMNFVSKKYL